MIKLVLVLHNLQLQIPMAQSNKTVALDPTEKERIHKEVEEVKDKKVLKVKKEEKEEKKENRVEKEEKVKEVNEKILTGAHSNLYALNKIRLVGKMV